MAVAPSIIVKSASPSAPPVSVTYTSPGDSAIEADITVPASTTNQLQTLAFLVANLKTVFIYSDKDVTLKTNSTGSPSNTFAIKGGGPAFEWSYGSGITNPFGTDVTKFYWSNAGGVNAAVNVRIGYNAG